MAKPAKSTRRRHRRTEEELIQALQAKIALLEQKKIQRAMKQDPVLRVADKAIRALKKAETTFQQNGRLDLANAAKAASLQISQCLR